MNSSDLEQLQELYDLMCEKNLDALEIKEADSRIKLTRRSATNTGVSPHPLAHPAGTATHAKNVSAPAAALPTIDSPLAGVFYRASAPTSAPFAKEGDVVEPSQTLCLVEAMKVMNEIKAESRCRIIKIIAENGRSVTAGQALFHIEPIA